MRQQRAHVHQVDESIVSVNKPVRHARRPHVLDVAFVPPDRDRLDDDIPGARSAREDVFIRARGDGRQGISSMDGDRFEQHGRASAQSASQIGHAVRPAAHIGAPTADPRILIVEDEWHAESPLQHRSEKRRVRRINGDEQHVERFGGQKPRARRQKPRQRAKPEVAEAECASHPRGPRARPHDAHSCGHRFGKSRIDPPLDVARVDGDDRGFPAVCRQMGREKPDAMRARRTVGRKVRADHQRAPHVTHP